MASEARPTKREAREQRRAERRRQQQVAVRKAQTTKYLSYGLVAVLLVLGAALAWGPISRLLARGDAGLAQGTQFPNQGTQHIAPGQPHDPYNSNPPTSGPHFDAPGRWGIYDQPQPDELFVHNLEHGGIVVHYNCAEACPELVEQLRDVVGQYRSKVILAPRPNKDVPWRITLTAWTWLDGFNEFDAARIRAFIAARRDKGPELIPD
jgi:hypothetical protein